MQTEWDRQRPQINSPAARDTDDTDEASSLDFEDEGSVSLSEHPRSAARAASAAKARTNLELLIKNSLVPSFTSSPFAHYTAVYPFPRSCNRPSKLSPVLDLRRVVLKRRLLQRLGSLSAQDEKELLPFASLNTPAPSQAPAVPDHNAVHPSNTAQTFSASPGLRRWISRPGFEDRFVVFQHSKDGIHQGPIVGTLAVAALEYSELVDVMVDPDFDPSLISPGPLDDASWSPSPDYPSHLSPSSLTTSTDPSQTSAPRHSYIPSPSPLRIQHSTDGPPPQSVSQPLFPTSQSLHSPVLSLPQCDTSSPPSPMSSPPSSKSLPTPLSPSLQSPPVKRVVRFAEDDTEDAVPLHLLRQKKMREEKAKFLRTEQRRRLMGQEQERRRLEAEAIEREKRRLVKEKERRDVEQRQYSEEVAAARLRRQAQRAGPIPGLKNDNNSLFIPSPSATSLREMDGNRPRMSRGHSSLPHYTSSSSLSPRREASDSALPITTLPYSHAYLLETSSYRGSNGGYSPVDSNSGHGHTSRPGSLHSTSSEDGRPGSKRHSTIAPVLNRAFAEYPSSFPAFSGSNQSLQSLQPIPPVPPLPHFVNDFVLLPPSAPFMMRQSRQSSPGPSDSSGSLRGNSANSSSERVNMQGRSFSRPIGTNSAPPSPGTSPSRADSKPKHSINGSGESKRSSMPVPPHSHSLRSQSSTLSRGRPQVAHATAAQSYQHPQLPSPWTALPTYHGNLPTVMPVSSYPHSMGLSSVSRDSSTSGSMRGKGDGTKRQGII